MYHQMIESEIFEQVQTAGRNSAKGLGGSYNPIAWIPKTYSSADFGAENVVRAFANM